MATYYHGGSEIQADGLQTLYLMNPNNYNNTGEYSDNHQQQSANNMLFLNSNPAATANALQLANISHAPPNHNQHFLGIPIPNVGSANSQDMPAHLNGILPRFHYNLWGPADQNTDAAAGNHPHAATTAVGASGPSESFDGFLHRPMVLSPSKQQGLSLTLSSQQPGSSVGGGSSAVSNGVAGVQSVILGSKYLKAAQQLLDEVVKVGKSVQSDFGDQGSTKEKYSKMSQVGAGDDGSSGGETSSRQTGTELTTAQKQELQMKKAKLVSMLDEVEQRYRQYHHQMHIVVSSFEQAAGIESAKSYTALALQTISKQFRCLKDAITSQIKATSKSLGVGGEDHDHSMGGGGKGSEAGSRLKFVDHQIRQQRALQQLGMIQHNAWRPQRGLPERAVSVLRAWLFEHFLHPYPKDSDKHILAKQTGLSRSQVSNWFINARVRLWKPMVEEMYLEEIKDQEQNGSDHTKDQSGSKASHDQQDNTATIQMDRTVNNTRDQPKQEMERIAQANPKKQKSFDKQSSSPSSILSMDMDMKMKPASDQTTKGIDHNNYGNYSFTPDNSSHGNGFGAYPIGEIGRFDPEDHLVTRYHHGSSVSLTLGLPHCENAAQQSYLPNQNMSHQLGSRVDMGGGGVEAHYGGISVPQPSHPSAAAYENRKFFAAQLLPDFVA